MTDDKLRAALVQLKDAARAYLDSDYAHWDDTESDLRRALEFADLDAASALAVSATDEGPQHIYLPWVVGGVEECSIPWCKASPADHPKGPSARPAVPEALDVERLARVLRKTYLGVMKHGSETLDDYRSDAEFIAREYAALSERPSDD